MVYDLTMTESFLDANIKRYCQLMLPYPTDGIIWWCERTTERGRACQYADFPEETLQ
jgi:hypothetical protein